MKDGAHTRRHGPAGSGLALVLGVLVGLALAAQLARAVAAVLHVLLIGLAVIVGLAIAGLIGWVVIACRRRPARPQLIRVRSWPGPAATLVREDREVVSLRQAVLELQAQLYAARAAALAERPAETHQHLHVHGLAPAQLAALLAAAQDRHEGAPVTGRTTRAERMAQPTARDAVRAVAENHGACLRPIQVRRIDNQTGEVEQVLIPCGATLASLCPPCAERAKQLRAAQCREGWHLETEPIPSPPTPDEVQAMWLEKRAQAQADRDHAAQAGQDTADLDALIGELDRKLTASGLRGNADPGTQRPRRRRSTRRRQDAPDLPRRKISPRTVGRTYTAPDGKTFRPSMFLTLTCPSYGKVRDDGTPVDPGSYAYQRAARDALHFAALFDRFVQNLRRVVGYEVQYFATVEPQKRLAPHVHVAIRGTVSRKELRQIIAATYHQVWWPSTDTVRFEGDHLPVWHEASGRYLDPSTGEFLPTWDEALDAIGPNDQPRHVARFGAKFDAQGVLAGSKDAGLCIGYLTKYLTKQLADCHEPETPAQLAHVERLVEALRFEPCSPTCSNWLRYGVAPKNPRPDLVPGRCKGKAHRRDHLGYGGQRVLTSRKWSGKTLADHRGDRQAWLMETLGISATDPARYRWEKVQPDDEDYMPPDRRLLHSVGDRLRWESALAEARRRTQHPPEDVSATGRAA